MNDPQITFQGIDCPDFRQQVKTLMDELIQLCPSDSAVRATFRHFQNTFVAEIKVASESVCMQVLDQAAALNDVLDHVKAGLLSQIVDWRNHRFAS
jgi:hypothetical protein